MVEEVNIKLRLCVNDTYGLFKTMHSLNEIIDALYTLSDTDYYLSHVFNGGTNSDAIIQNIFNEDDILNLAEKFEHIRAVVLSEMLYECSDNFRNLEYTILQSVWEQKYPKNEDESIVKYEKREVKNSYKEFVKMATELEKYFRTRYGEEIQE